MRRMLFSAALLLIPELASSQDAKPAKALTVSGYPGEISVVQVNGKSYVEVESLVRLTNSSMSFRADHIIVTLAAAPPAAAAKDSAPKGFSRDFLRAGIEQVTAIREFRTVILNAIQSNTPVVEDWVAGYRRNADSKLALASAAITTDADRSGFALLTNETRNMNNFADKYIELRKNGTGTFPDELANDPLSQQILNCANGLATLAAGGQFQDVPACH